MSETTDDLKVTVEAAPNQQDAYMVGGRPYYFRAGEDSPEALRREAKHLSLIADYMESDAQVERLRAKARRKAIAARYGVTTQWPGETTSAMIDRIMELEDALPKPAAPKLVKRPTDTADELLDLDDVGGH